MSYELSDIVISLIITALAYCAIPIIYRFIVHKGPMEKNNALLFSIVWSIIICIGFYVYRYFIIGDTSGISYGPAFLYGAINFAILSKRKNRKDKSVSIDTSQDTEKGNNDNLPKEVPMQISVNTSNLRKKTKFPMIITVICVVFMATSGYLLYQNQQLESEVTRIHESYESLSDRYFESKKYKSTALFFLDNAAIIKNGDNKYYHRYNCSKLGTQYEYQIYISLIAKQKGYKECPECWDMNAEEYISHHY